MTVADQAHALMQEAHRLIAQGEWANAAGALERAAEIHQQEGREYDYARCLQLAATLWRSSGDLGKARNLSDRAASGAADQTDMPLAVSIAAEQAQTAFGEGRVADANAAWTRAIEAARSAQAKPEAVSALLQKRAASQAATGSIEAASSDFEEAGQLAGSGAGFVQVAHAEILFDYGRPAQAGQILDGVNTESDAQLRADALVLRSKLCRAASDLELSIAQANAARDAALEAVAPVSYFAAAGELAQSFNAKGDTISAYGALATAWATISDLLGSDVAKSWVEPVLLAYKVSWGDPEFERAKAAYEQQRRSELGKEPHA